MPELTKDYYIDSVNYSAASVASSNFDWFQSDPFVTEEAQRGIREFEAYLAQEAPTAEGAHSHGVAKVPAVELLQRYGITMPDQPPAEQRAAQAPYLRGVIAPSVLQRPSVPEHQDSDIDYMQADTDHINRTGSPMLFTHTPATYIADFHDYPSAPPHLPFYGVLRPYFSQTSTN